MAQVQRPALLAVAIGVPPLRINEIAHGKGGITVDTALRGVV